MPELALFAAPLKSPQLTRRTKIEGAFWPLKNTYSIDNKIVISFTLNSAVYPCTQQYLCFQQVTGIGVGKLPFGVLSDPTWTETHQPGSSVFAGLGGNARTLMFLGSPV